MSDLDRVMRVGNGTALWKKCKDTFALLTHSHSAMTGATVNADGEAGF